MTDEVATYPAYPMERSRACPFDPPPAMRELQSHGLSKVRLWDGRWAWLVTTYDYVRRLLSDVRLSAERERPGFPFTSPRSAAAVSGDPAVWRIFQFMDDPEHQTVRRMLTADFTVRRMEAIRPRIQTSVDQLIDDLLAGPRSTDLVENFALPVPSLAICELLGVPYDGREVFQRCSRIMTDHRTPAQLLQTTVEEFNDFVAGVVRAKEASPGDDLLSRLVVQHLKTGNCTLHELVATARFLLFAGHDTTANMIALGTLALLQHPDRLAELRERSDDSAFVANAVEELLRYLSIVHFGRNRLAKDDIELDGHVIRAGEPLILVDNIANRDPEVFSNPDELQLDREARNHIAFGYGVHQCLGQPLARVELQVVLSTLYRRIPTMELAVPFAAIEFKDSMGIYGVHALPIRW